MSAGCGVHKLKARMPASLLSMSLLLRQPAPEAGVGV